MLKSAVCLLISFCLIQGIFSQEIPLQEDQPGFYGKRFQITIGTGGNVNVFKRLVNKSERTFRESEKYAPLREKSSGGIFNYSFHAAIGYAVGKRVTLSLDLNYMNSNALSLYSYSKYAYYAYAMRFKFQSYRLMPRIEISSKNSNSPIGFTHILGLGFEINLATSGNYPAYYYPINNNTSYIFTDKKIEFSNKPQSTVTMLYGIEYRIPIAKWVAINLGGYFHLNLDPNIFSRNKEYENFYEKTDRLMSKSRFQNLFSCRAGLMFMI